MSEQKLKDNQDYSVEAARLAATQTANASTFATSWLSQNIQLKDITQEDGSIDQKKCQQAAMAGFFFAKIIMQTQEHFYNDCIDEAEKAILNGEYDVPVQPKADRKTKGGIILPTMGMMKDHLRPDQQEFLNNRGGLRT